MRRFDIEAALLAKAKLRKAGSTASWILIH